jgi:hypothetical protein
MKILGINSFHADSSACIIIDGKIIAAAEEERFIRIKHYKGFPVLSINFCLNEIKLGVIEVTIEEAAFEDLNTTKPSEVGSPSASAPLTDLIENMSCLFFGLNSRFSSNTLCPKVLTNILIFSINSSISALSDSEIDDCVGFNELSIL